MRRKKTKNNKRWWIAAAAGVAAFGLLFFWFWQSSDAPIYDRGTTGLVSSDLLAQTTSNQKEEPKL
ncbi:MAG TPA: hypothetical protein PKN73_02800, partial [Candidatus Paceibacterota bacterium]|nr:hypothetical protein [Candidatus Paceibacterota bacterium]